jgi:Flp pilus assembly protein CpaB
MKNKTIWLGLVAAVIGLGLAACQSGSSGAPSGDSAAKTVEAYLQARVKSDETQMINLSCADWEAGARTEAESFKSMNAKLDGVTCQTISSDNNSAVVTCQGKIVTAYNGDTRDTPLTGRQYSLVYQDGEWRMCGYK